MRHFVRNVPIDVSALMVTKTIKNVVTGLAFFGVWYAVGYVWNGVAVEFLIIAIMGGNYQPPPLWMLAHKFGLYVLPVLTALGGAPVALQVARGKPWKRMFVLSVALVCAAWILVLATLFWLPDVMGWYW